MLTCLYIRAWNVMEKALEFFRSIRGLGMRPGRLGVRAVVGVLVVFLWGLSCSDFVSGYGEVNRIDPRTGRPYGVAVQRESQKQRKVNAHGKNLEPTKTLKKEVRSMSEGRAVTPATVTSASKVSTNATLPQLDSRIVSAEQVVPDSQDSQKPQPQVTEQVTKLVTKLVTEQVPEQAEATKHVVSRLETPEPAIASEPAATPIPVSTGESKPNLVPAPLPATPPVVLPAELPKPALAAPPAELPVPEKAPAATVEPSETPKPAGTLKERPAATEPAREKTADVKVNVATDSKEDFLTRTPRGIGGQRTLSATVPQKATSSPGDKASDGLVNYGVTASGINVGPNDILLNDAIVEIPKGEGYEALISANGQGLLVELGVLELDAEGNPVVDGNGETKRRPFHRGDRVTKGQILGKQNDREHAANKLVTEQQLIVAEKEAGKQLEVEVAQAAVQVAESEYLRAKSANERIANAISQEELVQRAYEWKRADKSAEKAVYDLDIKADEVLVRKAQVVAADAQVMDRKLVSPIDGFIDDIMQNEGQWLREGDNILKIIRLDKVTICGKIDATLYSPEMVDGKEVTIFVQKPGSDLKSVKGVITYARQVVESGKFYVYAQADNEANDRGYWLLNPGTIVTMVIHR
ncbi:MAG: HlyD family efflux transporter periplasmic adaptor subunit [Planctomycetia bacterium]|nr:HlyD family efflux transporter periplasmic adaptor subunit [Planctomycetia bacterium]